MANNSQRYEPCHKLIHTFSRIYGGVANYLASQAIDPAIYSHQHQKDSWPIQLQFINSNEGLYKTSNSAVQTN